jgi:hypothetical protein
MAIRHPIYDLGRGNEAGIRVRDTFDDVASYTLTAADVGQWPKFVLHWMAYQAYGRADLWERIADANPIKPEWAWQAGDVLLIPRKVLQKDALSSSLAALTRKIG